jgi:hypothetical protein
MGFLDREPHPGGDRMLELPVRSRWRTSATLALALLPLGLGTVRSAEEPAAGVPRLEVPRHRIYLPNIPQGAPAEARFVLRNTGDGVLRILSAKPG